MKISLIRLLLWLCVAVQAVFFFLAWTTFATAIGSMQIEMTAEGIATATKLALTPGQRAVGAALSSVPLLVMGYGLWRLDRLLLNFRRQDLFTVQSIGHLRAFAGATLASTLLSIAEPALRGIAFWLLAGGERHLAVGVRSEQIILLLVCGLFYLVTRLMQEGSRLAAENEAFI
jgi:hypothetical protein